MINTSEGMWSPEEGGATLKEVATVLSRIRRFSGQGPHCPDTVSQHSRRVHLLLAMWEFPPAVQLGGLLHDAHEAYIGDLATPWKEELGSAWYNFEERAARSVRRDLTKELGVLYALPDHPAIKLADRVALNIEAKNLFGKAYDESVFVGKYYAISADPEAFCFAARSLASEIAEGGK